MTSQAVVVIGSGPIGAVVARRLDEAGRAVTILESGPAISDPPGSHVRNQPRFQQDPDSYLAGISSDFTYFDETAAPRAAGRVGHRRCRRPGRVVDQQLPQAHPLRTR